MALFVRDHAVADMTAELQRLLNTPTKTEALRVALQHELERVRAGVPMHLRLAEVRAMADAMGPSDPKFDQKTFTDELWNDL